ncbi:MAG: MTH1187 family thiamine-binding protein [Methanomassiliicoccales archaeon]|nr:MTH1187 family thiamine-binding protein [Methanomassiliicoccales archaeon]
MIVEFSIIPVGVGSSLSSYVAECVRIVRESGLVYELTSMGTVLEGEGDEVIPVVMRCHERVMQMSERAVTIIKIDDRRNWHGGMDRKVRSVEEKL